MRARTVLPFNDYEDSLNTRGGKNVLRTPTAFQVNTETRVQEPTFLPSSINNSQISSLGVNNCAPLSTFQRIIHVFLPEEIDLLRETLISSDERLVHMSMLWRARLLVSFILIFGGPICALRALFAFAHGNIVTMAFPLGVMVGSISLLSWFRYSDDARHLDTVRHSFVALLFFSLLGETIVSGGLNSSSYFLVLVCWLPITTEIDSISPGPHSFRWFGVVCVYLIFLYFSHTNDWFSFHESSRMKEEDLITNVPLLCLSMMILTCLELTGRAAMSQETHMQRETLSKAVEVANSTTIIKSHFLTSMSHNLRTPLNGVLDMGQILEGSNNISQVERDLVISATNSCRILLSTLDSILDFCRLEERSLALDERAFNIITVIESVISMFNAKTFSKGLELLCDCPENCNIVGDQNRIRQVIINLMECSLRYASKGVISISVRVLASRTHNVSISIASDGFGLPEEFISSQWETVRNSSLHDMWSQLGNESSKTDSLGISISRQLMNVMGGELVATSFVEEGSRFEMKLKAPWGKLSASGSMDDGDMVPSSQNNRIKPNTNLRVLIVEDIKAAGDLACRQLSRYGYETRHVSSCRNAVEVLKSTRFHVVLLDTTMPDIKVAGDIRAMTAVPIILMASSRSQQEKYSHQMGRIETTIQKPVIWWSSLHHKIMTSLAASTDIRGGPSKRPTAILDVPTDQCMHIMVVDDNMINLKVAAKMLLRTQFKVEVHIFDDPKAAIKHFTTHQVDTVLMDVHMPVMDGLEATRQIRQMQELRKIKPVYIVAVTADVYAKEKCFRAGVDDFLRKPYTVTQLKEVLQQSELLKNVNNNNKK